MNALIKIVAVAALAFVLELFLPWWAIVIAALAVELALGKKGGKAFLTSFAGVFILWLGFALYLDAKNEHILSTKMASVLPAGGSYLALAFITALIGGLVAGLAGATGVELKKAIAK